MRKGNINNLEVMLRNLLKNKISKQNFKESGLKKTLKKIKHNSELKNEQVLISLAKQLKIRVKSGAAKASL